MLHPVSRPDHGTGAVLAVILSLALAACRSEADQPPIAPATPTATASEADPAPGARQVSEETATYLFEYDWPEPAGQVPALVTWLEARMARQRAELGEQAQEGLEAARDNGFPYNKYSTSTEWKVEADLDRWLSLSAQISAFTGGAHPNYGFTALVWDKEEGAPLSPEALFASPDALQAALGEELCAALDAERRVRRGADAQEDASTQAEADSDGGGARPAQAPAATDDPFAACVPVAETTLVLRSRSGSAFDRIGILIGPYVAGPYAEGTYEFTFDVSDAVLGAVKPEYRAAFAARN